METTQGAEEPQVQSEVSGDFEVSGANLSVSIGMPCGPQIPWPTALSLARTAHACAKAGVSIQFDVVCGSSIVTTARSCVAHRFLQGKQSRLFWIDSDIVWEPADFLRLLGLSTCYDIVCGAYPLKRETKSFVIKHPDLQNYEITPHGLIKIEGTGLGFTVMTREVVEKIAATKRVVHNESSDEYMAEMFRIDVSENGKMRGEDIAFFEDAKALGYNVWLDPTIQLGHVGAYTYRGDVVKALGLDDFYQAENPQ